MKLIYFSRTKIKDVEPLETMALPYVDITIVLDGTMRYGFNSEEVELHAGDVIIFAKGDVRSRKRGGFAEYYSFNMLFDEDDVLPSFNGILRNQITEEIKTLLSLYTAYSAHFSGKAEEKSNHCFLILYYTLYEMTRTPRENRYISQIKQYIAEHIHEPITVSQVSKYIFLSPNYCNTFFKTHTGQTLNDYIIKMKMSKAQYMILYTKESLNEIASSLGYKQYSYFSRVFTQEIHMSPAEYRKSITINKSCSELDFYE